MNEIIEKIWPLAQNETEENLRKLSALTQHTDWDTETMTTAYKMFHTMKSSMAIVNAKAHEELFESCEHSLTKAIESSSSAHPEHVCLLAEAVHWAGANLEKSHSATISKKGNNTLIHRISQFQG